MQTDVGIVLTKRSIEPFKGMWHIPGGTVRFGERFEEAVKRVAKEELGVEVGVIKLLGYINYVPYPSFDQPMALDFLVTIKFGKLRGSEQGEEFGIFKIDEIPENTIKEQKDFLESNL